MKRNLIASIVFNALIVALTVTGGVMLFTVTWEGRLMAFGFEALKFFTIDSNLLVGIIACIYLVFDILVLCGKMESIPSWLRILKHTGTVGVALTLLTVAFFLGPVFAIADGSIHGYLMMFTSYNLIFHLLTPLCAIISSLFFEREPHLPFKATFIGVIPMVLYGIYYSVNALSHAENGMVPPQYDWYSFVRPGIFMAPISVLIMTMATYVISLLLYLGASGRRQ